MEKPQTALDICNLALAELGEPPIPGIDPCGNLTQRLCYMHYHPTRREVLCAAPWSFAIEAATINSREPADGATRLPHTIPAETIRILSMSAPTWQLLGRNIYCPEPTIHITYITDHEAVETWPQPFIEAFTTRICVKLSIPLLNSTTVHERLLNRYTALITLANN